MRKIFLKRAAVLVCAAILCVCAAACKKPVIVTENTDGVCRPPAAAFAAVSGQGLD